MKIILILILIILVVSVLVYMYSLDEFYNIDPKLYRHFFNKTILNPKKVQGKKIFVSIASYRDNECPKTVKNLIENCSDPNCLNIVVCQQNSFGDLDARVFLTQEQKKLVTVETLDFKKARGPCWARWRIQQYYNNETFQLQIDSHTRFEKDWDKTLIKQLKMCDSDKPVLTQYLPSYNLDTGEKENKLRGKLYVKEIKSDKFTRIQSDEAKPQKMPFKSEAWGACFSFSKGEFIKENPYDEFTPFLFFGEEMDISIRSYMNGWDFYSPSVIVAYTSFKRDHRNTFWENPDQENVEILSRYRVYERLNIIKKENVYKNFHFIFKHPLKLGNKRTIKDYKNLIQYKTLINDNFKLSLL